MKEVLNEICAPYTWLEIAALGVFLFFLWIVLTSMGG